MKTTIKYQSSFKKYLKNQILIQKKWSIWKEENKEEISRDPLCFWWILIIRLINEWMVVVKSHKKLDIMYSKRMTVAYKVIELVSSWK